MADQQLTPENLESYSVEAISNYGRAIDEFCDVLIVSVLNSDPNTFRYRYYCFFLTQ